MNTEAINTMREAQHEIQGLRRRNEVLGAKVEVFDQLMCLFHSAPAQRSQGMSPDVVFALEKQIAKLEEADEEKPRPQEARPIKGERFERT